MYRDLFAAIVNVISVAPPAGVSVSDIAASTGQEPREITRRLGTLYRRAELHTTGANSHRRYYRTESDAIAAGAVDVSGEKERRLARVRKTAWRDRQSAKPGKDQLAPKGAPPTVTLPLSRAAFIKAKAIVPAHVVVQQLPGYRDRFEPEPGFVGEFMADWNARRAPEVA